jgi:hypothetical protein
MEKFKIKNLKETAKKEKLDIVKLESALLRYAKSFLRKNLKSYKMENK